MSERKIPIYLECGYSIAMQVLGGKWKICIIEALRDKPLRPSLIFKEVPDATERVINQQLKELLEYKIIDRKIYAEQPPRTEYFLTNLGRSAFPILDALDQWGEENRKFYEELFNAVIVSQEVLTEMFEVSRSTIYRAIKILDEGNYIKIYKSGTSNVYALNDDMVWNSWGTNKKYSKFNANVIISEDEQTEEIKKELKDLKIEKHKEVKF